MTDTESKVNEVTTNFRKEGESLKKGWNTTINEKEEFTSGTYYQGPDLPSFSVYPNAPFCIVEFPDGTRSYYNYKEIPEKFL